MAKHIKQQLIEEPPMAEPTTTQEKLSALNAAMIELMADLDVIENDNDELKVVLGDTKLELEASQLQTGELQSQLDEWKQHHADLVVENQQLGAKLDEVSILKEELNANEITITALTTTIDDMNVKLDEYEVILESASSRNNELVEFVAQIDNAVKQINIKLNV